MRIIFDVEYIFQRKSDSKIFIMKNCLKSVTETVRGYINIETQNYICTGKNWRKISVEKFNTLGLEYIDTV